MIACMLQPSRLASVEGFMPGVDTGGAEMDHPVTEEIHSVPGAGL